MLVHSNVYTFIVAEFWSRLCFSQYYLPTMLKRHLLSLKHIIGALHSRQIAVNSVEI